MALISRLLNESAAPRRAWRDVAESGAGADQSAIASQVNSGPIVRPEHRRGSADGGKVVEVAGELVGGDGAIHASADAFSGVFTALNAIFAKIDAGEVLMGAQGLIGSMLKAARGRGLDAEWTDPNEVGTLDSGKSIASGENSS